MRRLWTLLAGMLLACGPPEAGQGDRVRDAAGMLDGAERAVLERELALLGRETGVDLHVSLAVLEPAEDPALRAAADLQGRPVLAGPAVHGSMLLHDTRSRATRLELGYGLEAVIPDARAGAWLDDHAQVLLDADRGYEAIFLTARMLQDRIRHEALAGGFDPNPPARLAGLRFRSGGGGATSRGLTAPEAPRPAPPRAASGGSIEESYAAYLAWLEAGDPSRSPDLFSAASRGLLAEFPLTPGYLEFVAARESGRSYRVLERGERALLFFVDDPFLAPHFFRRTVEGWKLDLVAEAREVVNLSGGRYSWSFRADPGPALAPFSAALVRLDGVRRLVDGDNRPAVVLSSRHPAR